jgi:hypothetical protein
LAANMVTKAKTMLRECIVAVRFDVEGFIVEIICSTVKVVKVSRKCCCG